MASIHKTNKKTETGSSILVQTQLDALKANKEASMEEDLLEETSIQPFEESVSSFEPSSPSDSLIKSIPSPTSSFANHHPVQNPISYSVQSLMELKQKWFLDSGVTAPLDDELLNIASVLEENEVLSEASLEVGMMEYLLHQKGEVQYKGKSIRLDETGEIGIFIDEKSIPHQMSFDPLFLPRLISPLLPGKQFSDLVELAKSVVDAGIDF